MPSSFAYITAILAASLALGLTKDISVCPVIHESEFDVDDNGLEVRTQLTIHSSTRFNLTQVMDVSQTDLVGTIVFTDRLICTKLTRDDLVTEFISPDDLDSSSEVIESTFLEEDNDDPIVSSGEGSPLLTKINISTSARPVLARRNTRAQEYIKLANRLIPDFNPENAFGYQRSLGILPVIEQSTMRTSGRFRRGILSGVSRAHRYAVYSNQLTVSQVANRKVISILSNFIRDRIPGSHNQCSSITRFGQAVTCFSHQLTKLERDPKFRLALSLFSEFLSLSFKIEQLSILVNRLKV